MLNNYLTIAIRNLMKHKLYSAINVCGLALGIASCVLMFLFVQDELSFDKHFENIDNLHRLQLTFKRPNGQSIDSATSVIPALQILEDTVDSIADTTYLYAWKSQINIDERSGFRTINYVAPNFFSMFEFPFRQGSPETALSEPSTAVISAKFAKALFRDEDPVGRKFTVTRKLLPVTVTGVLADEPPNTHFETEVFVSRATVGDDEACGGKDNWRYLFCAHSYILMKDGGDIEDVEIALPTIVEQHAPNYERLGKVWPGTDWIELSTIPVKDIHLYSKRREEMKAGGDMSLVYVFSFLSSLILLIACINFTNLATARATDRSREISIRKIVGAERRQIIVQILGESILLASVALVIAMSVVEVMLPWYNSVIGKELTFSYGSDFGLVAALLALSIVVGFVGGIYPAFFLSSFRPVTISKGVFANVDRHIFLRSSLVVVQFVISIGLMSATFIVYAQMNYSKTQALQFDRESILALKVMKEDGPEGKMDQLAEILRAVDGVENVSLSGLLPPSPVGAAIVTRAGFDDDKLKVVGLASVDSYFFDIYGVDLVAGRNFSNRPVKINEDVYHAPTEDAPESYSNAIINEASLPYLGFMSPEDALGKTFEMGSEKPNFVSHLKIIGVVPDANFASTRQAIGPVIYHMAPSHFYAVSLKLGGENTEETIHWIKKSWALLYPDATIEMQFVDESYDELYAREVTRGRLFAAFSLLAMLLACLGLYGLAAVAAERRTQEIGLRKVMGASVGDIIKLLVWQFSRPVLIANLIAWPLAFWVMQAWLSGFVFRIDLTPLPFFASTAITLFVAFATVTWHARKVAMAKPAETLRYE